MNEQHLIPESSAFVGDQDLLEILEERARPVEFCRDLVLFRQGDPPSGVFIVKNGFAVLTMTSSAKIVMQVVTGVDSILGLPAVLGDSPYSLTADVTVDSHVDFLAKEDLVELMRTDPLLSMMLLQILSGEIRAARQALAAAV
jgi:CRP-like cAMP-binding protein